jgi:radical SAM protein with 4Fe4S-binding SPASM domain
MNLIAKIKRLFLKYKYTNKNCFPKKINIDVSSICNYRCIMCPQKSENIEQTNMTRAIFYKIIDDISKSETEEIQLHFRGEPLINPDLVDFIKYTKSKTNAIVGFSTNCSLLNKTKIEELCNSGINYIYLSIDGVTKETYEKIRVNGDFTNIIKNIHSLLEIVKERELNIKTYLSVIEMNETQNEINDFIKYWSNYGIEKNNIYIKKYSNFGGQINSFDNKKNKFQIACPRLWNEISILSNGDVVICCYDFKGEYLLDNAQQNNVLNIWQSNKQLNKFRIYHKKYLFDKLKICSNCTYNTRNIW